MLFENLDNYVNCQNKTHIPCLKGVFMDIKITYLDAYVKIETDSIDISFKSDNSDEIIIKREDNGKPTILFESKQR